MPSIALTPIILSYHYENHIFTQCNTSASLSYTKNAYGTHIDTLILTLSGQSINFSSMTLTTALLELPLKQIPNNFHSKSLLVSYVFTNSLSTNPCDNSYLNYKLSRNCFHHDNLCLNLTKIIKEWMTSNLSTCQIMLSINKPNLSLCIRKSHSIFPLLHIDYENYKPISPPSPSLNPLDEQSPILFLNSLKHACDFIRAGQSIVFDLDESNLIHNINYSSYNGRFSFPIKGYYLIQWVINLAGCASNDSISIGIMNFTNNEIVNFHSPTVLPGQITGQYVLQIKSPDHQYGLINNCNATIQLSTVITQASLIIFKI